MLAGSAGDNVQWNLKPNLTQCYRQCRLWVLVKGGGVERKLLKELGGQAENRWVLETVEAVRVQQLVNPNAQRPTGLHQLFSAGTMLVLIFDCAWQTERRTGANWSLPSGIPLRCFFFNWNTTLQIWLCLDPQTRKTQKVYSYFYMVVSWNRGTPQWSISKRIFHYRPTSYWDTPMTMETSI